ncbi:MAG: sorbosone dehydrogenase [Verrucomicrobia bacterium]|nr:sorbosone dehydrogenase [Verrucomicrobiota bacterium]
MGRFPVDGMGDYRRLPTGRKNTPLVQKSLALPKMLHKVRSQPSRLPMRMQNRSLCVLGFFVCGFWLASTGLADQAPAPASATGDLARGKTFFVQNCAVCHATGSSAGSPAAGGQGPTLAGVVGRTAGTAPGFSYTHALVDSKLRWDAASLELFLENPPAKVPGTTMVVVVANPADRSDVIAYLSTLAAPETVAETTTPQAAAVSTTANDAGAWRNARPGVKHHIQISDLPPPYSTGSAGNNPQVVHPPADAQLSVPAGFTVRRFAEHLSNPRVLRMAPNGDIFIAETAANRIRVIRAADGAETPSENQLYAEGLDRPFGIAFYPSGENPEWIYVGNNNSVVRFPYRSGDLKARGAPQVIVPRLTAAGTGGHSTRDVAFSRDGRRLFISVGSASNVAEGIATKSPEEIREWEAEHGRGACWDFETNRADILVTDPEGRAGLRTFATGIRNGVGLAVNPLTGDLWTSTNERDGLGDNLVPDYITRVKEGGYYGWPWYYLGQHEDPRLAGHRPDLAGVAIVPDVLVQAHSAALEMTFYPAAASGPAAFPAEYRGDIFAALHGSWNRATRTGYKIVRVHLERGVPDGSYEDFLTGFVVDAESVWGRPVGVAVAHDGALLMTDDGNNVLWRVAYVGANR